MSTPVKNLKFEWYSLPIGNLNLFGNETLSQIFSNYFKTLESQRIRISEIKTLYLIFFAPNNRLVGFFKFSGADINSELLKYNNGFFTSGHVHSWNDSEGNKTVTDCSYYLAEQIKGFSGEQFEEIYQTMISTHQKFIWNHKLYYENRDPKQLELLNTTRSTCLEFISKIKSLSLPTNSSSPSSSSNSGPEILNLNFSIPTPATPITPSNITSPASTVPVNLNLTIPSSVGQEIKKVENMVSELNTNVSNSQSLTQIQSQLPVSGISISNPPTGGLKVMLPTDNVKLKPVDLQDVQGEMKKVENSVKSKIPTGLELNFGSSNPELPQTSIGLDFSVQNQPVENNGRKTRPPTLASGSILPEKKSYIPLFSLLKSRPKKPSNNKKSTR